MPPIPATRAPPCSWKRFSTISSVIVGSSCDIMRRIEIICFWNSRAASWPGLPLAERNEKPSNPKIDQERVPVPCLPQLPVRPRSSAIARSIRSPW